MFRPESTPGGLTAAFEGIAEELRRQYNIGYYPQAKAKRVSANKFVCALIVRNWSYALATATSSVQMKINRRRPRHGKLANRLVYENGRICDKGVTATVDGDKLPEIRRFNQKR
jgi:hypothetical protein